MGRDVHSSVVPRPITAGPRGVTVGTRLDSLHAGRRLRREDLPRSLRRAAALVLPLH